MVQFHCVHGQTACTYPTMFRRPAPFFLLFQLPLVLTGNERRPAPPVEECSSKHHRDVSRLAECLSSTMATALIESPSDIPTTVSDGVPGAMVDSSDPLDYLETILQVAHSGVNRRVLYGTDVRRTPLQGLLKVVTQAYGALRDKGRQLDGSISSANKNSSARNVEARAAQQALRSSELLHRASKVLCYVYPTKSRCDHQAPAELFLHEMQAYSGIFTRDALLPLFQLPHLASKHPKASITSMRPIFVVGMMRSGSTLLEAMLNMHSEVAGLGEITALENLVHNLAEPLLASRSTTYTAMAAPLVIRALLSGGADGLRLLRERYMGHASAVYHSLYDSPLRGPSDESHVHRYFVDKHNHNFLYLWLVALLFADDSATHAPAKVIHCVRDGRDLGLSLFMQGFVAEFTRSLRAIGRAVLSERTLMNHWNRVFCPKEAKGARRALACVAAPSVLDGQLEILEVHYEELVADPSRQLRRVLFFLGLNSSELDTTDPRHFWKRPDAGKLTQNPSSDQVTRPMYLTSVGRHLRYGSQFLMKPLLEELRDSSACFSRDNAAHQPPHPSAGSRHNRRCTSDTPSMIETPNDDNTPLHLASKKASSGGHADGALSGPMNAGVLTPLATAPSSLRLARAASAADPSNRLLKIRLGVCLLHAISAIKPGSSELRTVVAEASALFCDGLFGSCCATEISQGRCYFSVNAHHHEIEHEEYAYVRSTVRGAQLALLTEASVGISTDGRLGGAVVQLHLDDLVRSALLLQESVCDFHVVGRVLRLSEELKDKCELAAAMRLLEVLLGSLLENTTNARRAGCAAILRRELDLGGAGGQRTEKASSEETSALEFSSRQRLALAATYFAIARLEVLLGDAKQTTQTSAAVAAALYSTALGQQPNNFQCIIELARTQLLMRDYPAAWATFQRAYVSQRPRALHSISVDQSALATRPMMGNEKDLVSSFKLDHDIEQLQHLIDIGAAADGRTSAIVGVLSQARAQFRSLFPEANRNSANPYGVLPLSDLPPSLKRLLKPVYNRPFYIPASGELSCEAHGPTVTHQFHFLNDTLDFEAIDAEYSEGSIVVVDNFLSPRALELLRRFALDAAVWHSAKVGGYLGAYIYDGFTPQSLHDIATEMEEAFPRAFDQGRHSLNMAWAYKYDSSLQRGIKLHVDEAAVNANFWLTENDNEASTGKKAGDWGVDGGNDPHEFDHDLGGMVVFRQEPPLGTPRERYNNEGMDHGAKRRELDSSGYGSVNVKHRANRLVLFKSNLWHMTAVNMAFRKGYKNRRINFTLLFGQRESVVCPARRDLY